MRLSLLSPWHLLLVSLSSSVSRALPSPPRSLPTSDSLVSPSTADATFLHANTPSSVPRHILQSRVPQGESIYADTLYPDDDDPYGDTDEFRAFASRAYSFRFNSNIGVERVELWMSPGRSSSTNYVLWKSWDLPPAHSGVAPKHSRISFSLKAGFMRDNLDFLARGLRAQFRLVFAPGLHGEVEVEIFESILGGVAA